MKPTDNQQPIKQKIFDFVVANAREMIFNDNGVKTVLDKMKAAQGGPAQAIGHTAVMLMKSVAGGLKEQNLTIPPDVMFAAYRETVGDLTELAAAYGIVPPEQKRQIAVAALQEGAKIWQATKNQPTSPPAGQQPVPPGAPPVSPGGLINASMGAQQ